MTLEGLSALTPALRVYIAGPMRGIAEFNFPAFHAAAANLRAAGYEVFSPAEKDIEHHGADISDGNDTGCLEQASMQHGFSLRRALGDDTKWICEKADVVAVLPGWENSKGAQAEVALARALGLQLWALPGAKHPETMPAMPKKDVLAEGYKADHDKLPVHLLPTDSLEAITSILQFGAKKYAPRNWEKGMAWSRPYSACVRHLFAWWRGEHLDPETGMSHLWHAGACILFLIAYEQRKIGTDDRPISVAPPVESV
jgi:hypothetical protein